MRIVAATALFLATLAVMPISVGAEEEFEKHSVEFSDDPEEFAIRFGAAYEIELCRGLSISPEFNVDLVDGETTLVYGASLGWGF
jgi:hypothetical protein